MYHKRPIHLYRHHPFFPLSSLTLLLLLCLTLSFNLVYAYGVSGVLSSSNGHTCAIKSNGSIVCWGANGKKQSNAPAGNFVQVSAGYEHTCALETTGKILCWGGGKVETYRPLEGDFVQVNAGGYGKDMVCGLKTDGSLACSGYDIKTPPTGTFTQVSVGYSYACAIRTDSNVLCWGDNFLNGSTPTGAFKQVATGNKRTCAITTEGRIMCWGGLYSRSYQPPTGSFNHIQVGDGSHYCAIRDDGKTMCWGFTGRDSNGGEIHVICDGAVCTPKLYFWSSGSIFDTNETGDRRAIPPAGDFVWLTVGRDFSCGVKSDQSVTCWGKDDIGQATPPAGLKVLNLANANVNPKPTNGVLITPDIWMNAEIQTLEKGAINAVWRLGGDSTTARGDRVIWGYFYASPTDVAWGSENNPDLYVKAWYDASGRIDVNFFHVSVPNIKVYSAKNNGGTLADTATVDNRYVRHTYYPDNNQEATVTDTRNASVVQATYPPDKADEIIMQASIKTLEKGTIKGEFVFGGGSDTVRGDHVSWGYLYANPSDVSWGSIGNPEVFVKVWADVSGRTDVNFFHVSVPDIDVSSHFIAANGDKITSVYNSTVTLNQRYSRHEYTPQ
ncbi:MAG: hypothetical protein BWK78_03325 [Thiotrichaceae bacterium IS1]|nr:MAG: hypothetical protein BWK78_03325 [Thiotrichaceae bacterium IS1]